jgi:hypothetical protein
LLDDPHAAAAAASPPAIISVKIRFRTPENTVSSTAWFTEAE